MQCILGLTTPQLRLLHRGKVRDSFRVDKHTRLILTTDRISAFDRVLDVAIPAKGGVLNSLSAFWFAQTQHIVRNHLIQIVDPNIALVHEAQPLRVEVIMRGYMAGSMWRAYAKGKRTFSGVVVPDGLTQHQRLPRPILTPTTKDVVDTEITPENIVADGLVTASLWKRIESVAQELFSAGCDLSAKRGMLLVDTKYEFGLLDGELVLIDELHTPDSSRFWFTDDYARDPVGVKSMDKEFVRRWLLDASQNGQLPTVLPPEIVDETVRRYCDLYQRFTGEAYRPVMGDVRQRVYGNLVQAGIIRDGYVSVVMGSPADESFCLGLVDALKHYDVAVDMRVVSAHKTGEDLAALAAEYNGSIEPGAIIAVAGLSNGLGGALAANLDLPVFSCPPFKDTLDALANINSSLFMPSQVPNATILRPANAVQAAVRSLNLARVRDCVRVEIETEKQKLKSADARLRSKHGLGCTGDFAP